MKTHFLAALAAAAVLTFSGCSTTGIRKQAASNTAKAQIDQPPAPAQSTPEAQPTPAATPVPLTPPAVPAPATKPQVAIAVARPVIAPQAPAPQPAPVRWNGPSATDRRIARILTGVGEQAAEILDDGPESLPQVGRELASRKEKIAEFDDLDDRDAFANAAREYLRKQDSAMEAQKDLMATILAAMLMIKKAEQEGEVNQELIEKLLPEIRNSLASFGREFDKVLPAERRAVAAARTRGVAVDPVFAQNASWRQRLGKAATALQALEGLQALVK